MPAHSLQQLTSLLNDYPEVIKIVAAISQAGGKAYLVGGAVRDLLIGYGVKDLDIEVHNLTIEQLQKVLAQFGKVRLVGKSFGVLRLYNLDVDWSLPRSDAAGRKPSVSVDPFMGIKDACSRRDLTINAMLIDLETFELLDPFDGQDDLEKRRLRAPDAKKFVEDPLRFYRVMQFIGRFEMEPDTQLDAICKTMNVSDVSVERIENELYKLFTKSVRPSLAFRWLQKIDRLDDLFPELFALIGLKQEPRWHPEGDVYEHTMQAIDAAAQRMYHDSKEKYIIVYAALCHDLGKLTTTTNNDGVIKSYGHEQESERIAKQMLKRLLRNQVIKKTILKLVRYHMRPMGLVQGKAKPSAYKRLASKLAPEVTLQMLADLAYADRLGRNPQKGQPLPPETQDREVDEFIAKSQKANVFTHIEKPILQGKDLLDVFKPGPELGAAIKKAYNIQLEQNIKNKSELKRLALSKKNNR